MKLLGGELRGDREADIIESAACLKLGTNNLQEV
jgi:hypothetical protein